MAFASLVQLGEFDKVNRHLPRVMQIARRSGQPALISNTLSQLGMICWFEGRYEEGLRATEEGLAIARALESAALIFSNQIMQTNILHDMGQVGRAIAEEGELCAMLTGDLETARLGAASIPSATALAFMGWFMNDTGDYDEGLDYAERALAIAVRERDPYSEVLARHTIGQTLLKLHRNAEAVECVAIAREISERNGYDAIRADLDGRMAIALSRTGRAAEAIRIVENCLRKKLHRRTGRLEIYYLYAGYAEALLRSGETERGFAALDEALRVVREVHNPCLIVDGLGLRARMLAELAPGDPRIAADLAERDSLCERYGLVAWPEISSEP
jgi:tetratricopeptide (TPR) repeat protein